MFTNLSLMFKQVYVVVPCGKINSCVFQAHCWVQNTAALQHWAFVKSRAHTQFVNGWISDSSMKTVWALPLLMKVQCDTWNATMCIRNMWWVKCSDYVLIFAIMLAGMYINWLCSKLIQCVCTFLLSIEFSIPLYLCYFIANHCWYSSPPWRWFQKWLLF